VPRGTATRELADPELRALQVDVRVDERGREEAPFQVERLPRPGVACRIVTHPGDPPADDRDRHRLDLVAEGVDDPPAAQDEVGGRAALGHVDQGAERGAVHRTSPVTSDE